MRRDIGGCGRIVAALALAAASAAGERRGDVVLEAHVLREGVGAGEGLVAFCGEYRARDAVSTSRSAFDQERGRAEQTWTRADERFLARVGADVGYEGKARRLREAATATRRPLACVIRLVHANVI